MLVNKRPYISCTDGVEMRVLEEKKVHFSKQVYRIPFFSHHLRKMMTKIKLSQNLMCMKFHPKNLLQSYQEASLKVKCKPLSQVGIF